MSPKTLGARSDFISGLFRSRVELPNLVALCMRLVTCTAQAHRAANDHVKRFNSSREQVTHIPPSTVGSNLPSPVLAEDVLVHYKLGIRILIPPHIRSITSPYIHSIRAKPSVISCLHLTFNRPFLHEFRALTSGRGQMRQTRSTMDRGQIAPSRLTNTRKSASPIRQISELSHHNPHTAYHITPLCGTRRWTDRQHRITVSHPSPKMTPYLLLPPSPLHLFPRHHSLYQTQTSSFQDHSKIRPPQRNGFCHKVSSTSNNQWYTTRPPATGIRTIVSRISS